MEQLLWNAIFSSSIYILTGLGFSLIYSVTRVLNFAYGVFYCIAAYCFYYFFEVIKLFIYIWRLCRISSAPPEKCLFILPTPTSCLLFPTDHISGHSCLVFRWRKLDYWFSPERRSAWIGRSNYHFPTASYNLLSGSINRLFFCWSFIPPDLALCCGQ